VDARAQIADTPADLPWHPRGEELYEIICDESGLNEFQTRFGGVHLGSPIEAGGVGPGNPTLPEPCDRAPNSSSGACILQKADGSAGLYEKCLTKPPRVKAFARSVTSSPNGS
jgi:hypothetical protein